MNIREGNSDYCRQPERHRVQIQGVTAPLFPVVSSVAVKGAAVDIQRAIGAGILRNVDKTTVAVPPSYSKWRCRRLHQSTLAGAMVNEPPV